MWLNQILLFPFSSLTYKERSNLSKNKNNFFVWPKTKDEHLRSIKFEKILTKNIPISKVFPFLRLFLAFSNVKFFVSLVWNILFFYKCIRKIIFKCFKRLWFFVVQITFRGGGFTKLLMQICKIFCN